MRFRRERRSAFPTRTGTPFPREYFSYIAPSGARAFGVSISYKHTAPLGLANNT